MTCLLSCLTLMITMLPVALASDTAPRLPAVRQLRSNTLVLEVMEPNAPERYNHGTRFTSIANVLRVTREGREFLFAPLEHDPLLENGGLAGEFDPFGNPPGFAEAALGEGYVKIGVGILRKEKEEYGFWGVHPVIERAATTVEWKEDKAFFRQECPGVNGYAYRLEAEVAVTGNEVAIRFHLMNRGAKAFTTQQYHHNYFIFGPEPVGPGYELELPFAPAPENVPPVIRLHGNRLRYSTPLAKAVNFPIPWPRGENGPNRVVLRHEGKGMELIASTDRPGTRLFIHAGPQYLCPEQFIELHLAPGQSVRWTRRYEFNLLPDHS